MFCSDMKVEVVAKEAIEPSSPTPDHLRTFKFSFFDQTALPMYTKLVLFYSASSSNCDIGPSFLRSQRLKKSLAETLTRFYPIAGRIKDRFSVDCNDEGAQFVEARAHCSLANLLEKPSMEQLHRLIPSSAPDSFSSTSSTTTLPRIPLLFVQDTFFNCGGMALGLAICHKIADASSVSAFLKCWSGNALGSLDVVVPDFVQAALLFPSTDLLPSEPTISDKVRLTSITRRYVFESSKITKLKAKAASTSVPRPSRVEAISALICKCATDASRTRLGSSRPPVLISFVANMRGLFEPPLPAHSFGNVVGTFLVQVNSQTSELQEVNLSTVVAHMRQGIKEFRDHYIKTLQGDQYWVVHYNKRLEREKMLQSGEVDLYFQNSWCNFPFYEVDFGWGKPTWASPIRLFTIPNMFRLIDARDGGIEAWVAFNAEEDVALFEASQELQEFASFNPSVAI